MAAHSADLAAGIFAGALTSTPALAAATEGLGAAGTNVVIGYGIAYPFGVIGVVLFVQLVPKLLRRDIDKEAEEYKKENEQYNSVLSYATAYPVALIVMTVFAKILIGVMG